MRRYVLAGMALLLFAVSGCDSGSSGSSAPSAKSAKAAPIASTSLSASPSPAPLTEAEKEAAEDAAAQKKWEKEIRQRFPLNTYEGVESQLLDLFRRYNRDQQQIQMLTLLQMKQDSGDALSAEAAQASGDPLAEQEKKYQSGSDTILAKIALQNDLEGAQKQLAMELAIKPNGRTFLEATHLDWAESTDAKAASQLPNDDYGDLIDELLVAYVSFPQYRDVLLPVFEDISSSVLLRNQIQGWEHRSYTLAVSKGVGVGMLVAVISHATLKKVMGSQWRQLLSWKGIGTLFRTRFGRVAAAGVPADLSALPEPIQKRLLQRMTDFIQNGDYRLSKVAEWKENARTWLKSYGRDLKYGGAAGAFIFLLHELNRDHAQVKLDPMTIVPHLQRAILQTIENRVWNAYRAIEALDRDMGAAPVAEPPPPTDPKAAPDKKPEKKFEKYIGDLITHLKHYDTAVRPRLTDAQLMADLKVVVKELDELDTCAHELAHFSHENDFYSKLNGQKDGRKDSFLVGLSARSGLGEAVDREAWRWQEEIHHLESWMHNSAEWLHWNIFEHADEESPQAADARGDQRAFDYLKAHGDLDLIYRVMTAKDARDEENRRAVENQGQGFFGIQDLAGEDVDEPVIELADAALLNAIPQLIGNLMVEGKQRGLDTQLQALIKEHDTSAVGPAATAVSATANSSTNAPSAASSSASDSSTNAPSSDSDDDGD